ANMDAGETQVFQASVTGDASGSGVTWAVTGGGTLSNQSTTSVTLTAPSSAGTVTLTATSKAATSKTKVVTIKVAATPKIHASALPNGVSGKSYDAPLTVDGGTAPYTWSIIAGSLPPGLHLDAATTAIDGMPTSTGTYNFTLQIVDSSVQPQTATLPETLIV